MPTRRRCRPRSVFTGFVMVVDFLLVGLVILRSLEMFASPLGTWIPFGLIFASSWLTGVVVTRQGTGPAHPGRSALRGPVSRRP